MELFLPSLCPIIDLSFSRNSWNIYLGTPNQNVSLTFFIPLPPIYFLVVLISQKVKRRWEETLPLETKLLPLNYWCLTRLKLGALPLDSLC